MKEYTCPRLFLFMFTNIGEKCKLQFCLFHNTNILIYQESYFLPSSLKLEASILFRNRGEKLSGARIRRDR